jgi:hypothetical protein
MPPRYETPMRPRASFNVLKGANEGNNIGVCFKVSAKVLLIFELTKYIINYFANIIR